MLRPLIALSIPLALVLACNDDENTTTGDSPPSGSIDLPSSTLDEIATLLAEKEARTPAQQKIASQLLYEASGRFAVATADTKDDSVIRSLVQRDERGRVLVDIAGDAQVIEARVAALGGSSVGSVRTAVRAWMPLDRLEDLASDGAVMAVNSALGGTTGLATASNAAAFAAAEQLAPISGDASTSVGAATSQGTTAHGAVRARKYFNTDGSGVRIGVISDSDDHKEQSIATGDLPADTVTLPDQSGRPFTGEGTAMMEIIHDVAPGAQLYFATAFGVGGAGRFAQNIRDLRFLYRCDIIVDDVLYWAESPFQDDIVAQAVADVIADGAVYLSSAGNNGNADDGTSGTWAGNFADGGPLATVGGGYEIHDFGHGAVSNRVEKQGGPLVLQWSDPSDMDTPVSSNDYDLFVLSADLRSVAVAATNIQNGSQWPYEYLGYYIPPNYRIVVVRKTGALDRMLQVNLFNGELGVGTGGATYGHNSVAAALSVGAANAAQAGGGEFAGGATTQVELFSGDGPRKVYYDRDGNPNIETRRKPDLVGADGVVTSMPSGSLNPFFGTSAAAAHVAGIAALVKSALPNARAAKIRSSLLSGAIDIEGEGYDRDSGQGVASAFDALAAAGAQPAVYFDVGTVVATDGVGGPIEPGDGGVITVQLVNNGGADASTVRASLTSSTPGVTITQGLSSYGDIAAGGSGTGATPFAFSLSSGAACGIKLEFDLSVAFVGRGTSPTGLHFSVQTGHPAATPVVFTYSGVPVGIPDNNPAGVNIPLTVAGMGALSEVVFSFDGTTCTTANGATTVGLDHTFVGDLVARLTSPAGTAITLMARPGGTSNSGNNFCQTVLTDAAGSSIQAITAAGAPYTGSFTPATYLQAFFGENASGTWTLNMSDVAAADLGSVRAFSIAVRGFECGP